jgi:hypothetical protein
VKTLVGTKQSPNAGKIQEFILNPKKDEPVNLEEPVNMEELCIRLRNMTDQQLLGFSQSAEYLTQQENPSEGLLLQLKAARAEFLRRKQDVQR